MAGNHNHAAYHPQSSRYTLVDVWHAIQTEANFNYAFWLEVSLTIIFEHAVKYFSSLLVIIAIVLILFISVCGFFILIPRIAAPFSLWFSFNIVWGITLVVNILFNYTMAVCTDPGYTNLDGHHIDEEAADRYCKKCNLRKPKRSHHCSICRRCVVKMDHHCPWINNCVGHGNYRYFFLFLLWTFTATFYLTVITAPVAFEPESILRAVVDDIFHRYTFKNRKSSFFSFSGTSNLRGFVNNTSVNYSLAEGSVGQSLDNLAEIAGKSSSKLDLYTFVRFVIAFSTMKSSEHRQSISAAASTDISPLSPVDMLVHADILNQRLSSLSRSDLAIMIIFLVSSGVCIGVGALLSFHVYLGECVPIVIIAGSLCCLSLQQPRDIRPLRCISA
jgi:hypothetical protein